MGCWDDGGGWVRVGVRGWAISSSGRTAPRSGNMSLSGRYPEHDICEDFNAIDVRELQRKTQMRPGLCFIKEWFRNGAPAGEVSIFIHPDAVILVHRARYPGSTESRIIELQVPIIWTKCHLGGRRPWFKCQAIINGEVCGRRVAKLYAPCFACRRCLGLGYESQREIPQRRAERRAQKIKMRLGGSNDPLEPFPQKPRGVALLEANIIYQSELANHITLAILRRPSCARPRTARGCARDPAGRRPPAGSSAPGREYDMIG